MATSRPNATCPCGRGYSMEEANDPGVCCICARDRRMTAMYGPGWRGVVRALRQAGAL